MILVRDLSLHIEKTELEREALLGELCRRLEVSDSAIDSFRILKESVDARKKEDIYFNYQVLVSLKEEAAYLAAGSLPTGVSPHYEEVSEPVVPGEAPLTGRIIVVGFGPAGIFAGLTLARAGYRPLILERGPAMAERTSAVERFWQNGAFDPAANVQFGEGGAGAFSDGKLTTRIRDLRVEQVLSALTGAGAPEEILYRNKPHVGTDLLKGVVMNLRREILQLGGEIRFSTRLLDLRTANGRVTHVNAGGNWIQAAALILCPGHSARDTYEMLHAHGVAMESKAFAVGLRVEHLQAELDQNQYGVWASHPKLRASEYSLTANLPQGRGVYSFCMCPGGQVVNASSEDGLLCVNGMSYHARDLTNANSAVVVSVSPADFGTAPLSGIAFQRELERTAFRMGGSDWKAPVQLTSDFLKNRVSRDLKQVYPSVTPGFAFAPLHQALPPAVTASLQQALPLFGRRIRGFDKHGLLTGVEARTSAPLRILRGADLQSPSHQGLYPCGEGAGYAGGIVSAAVDGIKAAEAVIRTGRPTDSE